MPANDLNVERDAQILTLRAAGWTFSKIGAEFGFTRQRAQQVWERAVAPRQPSVCWCGELAPIVSGPGKPARYCSREHTPSIPKRCREDRGVNRRLYSTCNSCSTLFDPPRTKGPRCSDCEKKSKARRVHYKQLYAAQNGVCAICRQPETAAGGWGEKRARKLSIDHCHATEGLRGLLCSNCNIMLGHAHDDIAVLQAAIDYLKLHAV